MLLSASRLRQLLVVSYLLLLLAAGYGLGRIRGLRALAEERERTRLQESLENAVSSWEDDLLAGLAERAEQAAANPDRLDALQAKWRTTVPWLDAVFAWPPPANRPGQLLFPVPAASNLSGLRQRSPCLARHRDLAAAGALLDEQVAELVLGCRAEDPSVRLYAGVTAARLLDGAGRAADALAVLDATAPPPDLPLREAAARGLDTFQLAASRSARAVVLLELARTDAALDLAASIGREVTELDAPELGACLFLAQEHLRRLRKFGRTEQADDLRDAAARANRRLDAYTEVLTRLAKETRPAGQRDGRVVVDAYSDHPFLLYYTRIGGVGIAFALDGDALQADFLSSRVRGSRTVLLQDARSGDWRAGSRGGGDPVLAGVPFPRTLTHRRVNVREAALRSAVEASAEQWLLPGLLTIAFTVGAGLVFVLIDRNVHQNEELVERQRAFATRVTHELKTPLAGIRVMAESLEMGAGRTEADREEMARRIVGEADQLTRKIDQILQSAKERTIPKPVPFEVEDLLYEIAEEWGPRFRDAGVGFVVDASPTDPVLGDPAALRDALACLVDNALKYRRDDAASPRVEVTSTQDGRHVEVRVRDNGLGVPKAMRKRIFERFVRVEGPNRGKAGGHGLGLHQVKEIVAAHRGTVVCTDGDEGGSTFVVRVPAVPPPRA